MFTIILSVRSLLTDRLRSAQALLGVIALGLCSCASVSVKDIDSTGKAQPQRKPHTLAVSPFSLHNTRINPNRFRKTASLQALGVEARDALSADLVRELSKHIAPSKLANENATHPNADIWLVTGRITRVAEGNRFLRMAIGLGAGGSKLETKVEVRANSPLNPPFLRFSTTGGSNATPGAATNPIPYSALPSAIMGASAGVNDDAARTARMITAEVADYMVKRGWLAAGSVPKPKLQSR